MAEKIPHPAIQMAVAHFRSQVALAKAVGSSQSAISRMLLREIPVSAEVASAIHKATDGKVPKWKLRPDLWDAPIVPRGFQGVEVRP